MLKKIMLGNFPNLGRKWKSRFMELKKISNRINPKKTTIRHIIIKLSKVND